MHLLADRADLVVCMGSLLAFSCTGQNSGTSDPKPGRVVEQSPVVGQPPAVEQPPVVDAHDAATAEPRTNVTSGGRKNVELRVEPDPSVEPLAGADTAPLPATALVRYQVISHGPSCAGNNRFVVHGDGRLFFQQNKSGGDCDRGKPFDEPFSATPTKTMPADWVAGLKQLISEHGFFDLAAGYRAKRPGRGGAMHIMDVGLDGRSHRVVVERLGHPALDAIAAYVKTAVYE